MLFILGCLAVQVGFTRAQQDSVGCVSPRAASMMGAREQEAQEEAIMVDFSPRFPTYPTRSPKSPPLAFGDSEPKILALDHRPKP